MNKNQSEEEVTAIFDNENHPVGGAVYGSEADMMADVITLIINRKLTGNDLRSMIFSFPTYSIISSLVGFF